MTDEIKPLPPPRTVTFQGTILVEQRQARWIVRAVLVCVDGETVITVPAGFVTDFASVPRPLWAVWPPTDPHYSAAAIVHDRLYYTHELPRPRADALFRRAMRVTGARWLTSLVLWAAVRLGGRRAYASGPVRQRAVLDLSPGLESKPTTIVLVTGSHADG